MRKRQVRKGAGSLLLAIGLICLTVVVVNLAKDVSIWVFGQRTTAKVVDTWIEQSDDVRAPTFQYFVRYQFTTLGGKTVTGTSRVGAREWAGMGMGGPVDAVYQEQATVPQYGVGGLGAGNPVAVVYFPLHPAHNRLDESRFVPVLACSYIPLILLGGAGLAGGRRLLRNT